jgi:hypothetical protein
VGFGVPAASRFTIIIPEKACATVSDPGSSRAGPRWPKALIET